MAILSEIMDGIVFVDQDGNVSLINPVAEELLGTRAIQVTGHQLDAIRASCAELVQAVIHDQGAVEGTHEIVRTVEVQVDEHEVTYVNLSTSRVFDCDRNFAGVMTLIRDITAEYKSDQLRNQYLSIVAHELRTPLTGIKTFSTLMAGGALGGLTDQQTQAIESIKEQSIRLEHQIDKLINLGNLDANEYAQDPEVVEVVDLVEASIEPFIPVAAESGVEIHVNTEAAKDARVRVDRTDMKRVLKSLIENAVKFTPEGGSVSVMAETADGKVQFAVVDSGIGIDRRYHRRIFEKFFQVEDPLTRHHGGAGLGLFVAQGIVEAHGSQIAVASELGSGASFRFALPLFEEGREEHSGTEVASAAS